MSDADGDPSSLPSRADHRRTRPSLLARWNTHRKAQSKLRRRLVRSAFALVLLVVVVAGSAIGYVEYRVDQIGRVDVHGLTAYTGGPEDILLVGSTSRCAVPANAKHLQNFVNQCESGVNGVNSDVDMILRVDPKTGRISLLSIPRDTFVPNARAGDLSNKIDAALYNGPSQLIAAIQEDFGIPINHYVVLNFNTFAGIVTALGGISMYFPTSVMDQDSGLYVNRTGCVHISGLEALALVRARHMYYHYDKATGTWLDYDGSGDLGRIERDHLFLNALAKEVAQRGLGNPLTDNNLLSALAPDLTVESTFSTSEMVKLLLEFHNANIASVPELTLPIVIDPNEYIYKGYPYGDVVFPTEPQDQKTIDEFMGISHPKTVAPSSIRVSTIDGTGDPTATAEIDAALASDGYHFVGTSPGVSVGPVSETTVDYAGAASLAEAEQVASSLRGTVVLQKIAPEKGADITVVTGSDLSVAPPPATITPTKPSPKTTKRSNDTTASSASSSETSTTAPPSSAAGQTSLQSEQSAASAGLGTPTSATEAIPWYDPRACTPAQLAAQAKHLKTAGTTPSRSTKKKSSK